jgi:hypothetical protein
VLIPVLDNEKHYWVGDDEGRQAPPPWRRLARVTPRARPHRHPLPQVPPQSRG